MVRVSDRYSAKPHKDADCWVVIEDMYDHDTYELGPFTHAVACDYCDAYNGKQLRADPVPTSIKSPTKIGVWNMATTRDYDFAARMAHLLAHPADIPGDADGIAGRAGVKRRSEWRALELEKIPVERCFCEQLRAGEFPHASSELVSAYYHRCLQYRQHGIELSTAEHLGDVNEFICTLCQGPVLKLTIEHEGYGDCIHHYYVPIDSDTLLELREGSIHTNNIEAWFGSRPGIHVDRGVARLYVSAVVGYAGMDSHTDFGLGQEDSE